VSWNLALVVWHILERLQSCLLRSVSLILLRPLVQPVVFPVEQQRLEPVHLSKCLFHQSFTLFFRWKYHRLKDVFTVIKNCMTFVLLNAVVSDKLVFSGFLSVRFLCLSQNLVTSECLQVCQCLQVSQENGPVCHIRTWPEILLVYRAHPVTIVHKISAADTLYNGAKKLPKFGTYSSNSRHRAPAWRPCAWQ
jgi:hypothetical protein